LQIAEHGKEGETRHVKGEGGFGIYKVLRVVGFWDVLPSLTQALVVNFQLTTHEETGTSSVQTNRHTAK
jgi:hypothetical protein